MCTLLREALVPQDEYLPLCVIYAPSCECSTSTKNPIFGSIQCRGSLAGGLRQQLIRCRQSKVRKNTPRTSRFGLFMCAYVCIRLLCLSRSFAACGSVFLTCVGALQNKQRWEEAAWTGPSTQSPPQTLHENRWLWHYQQSQLVSHACSGGDRTRLASCLHSHHHNDEEQFFITA